MRFSKAHRAIVTPFMAALALAVHAVAQQGVPSPPPPLVAQRDLLLAAKTPLGDALIKIAAGTAIADYELAGDQIVVRQGPFSAVFERFDVTPPAPSPSPQTSPEAKEAPASSPSPSSEPSKDAPSPTPPPTMARAEPASNAPTGGSALLLPDWLLPAAVGALAAYALFATVVLLRPRRTEVALHRPVQVSRPSNVVPVPVVALPAKSKPKSSAAANVGQGIACPLCRKNIPADKTEKGRNRCPSCGGAFICE